MIWVLCLDRGCDLGALLINNDLCRRQGVRDVEGNYCRHQGFRGVDELAFLGSIGSSSAQVIQMWLGPTFACVHNFLQVVPNFDCQVVKSHIWTIFLLMNDDGFSQNGLLNSHLVLFIYNNREFEFMLVLISMMG